MERCPPPPPPFNYPKHKSAESTPQKSDSHDTSMPASFPESQSRELAFLTTSPHPLQPNLSSPTASSSEVSSGDKNTRSLSPRTSRHSQKLRSTTSTPGISSSSPIFTNTNPQISHTAEKTSGKDSSKFLHVMEIMDKQDLGRLLLSLTVPMGVSVVVSGSSLIETTGMRIVTITLSFATALMWNGLLLRETYRKSSTLILISGAALMMLSFYSLIGCYLPVHLIWIPVLCGLASLFPLAMYGWARFRRGEMKQDPENGG